jgi:glucose/arabinose dehydrogenase
MLSAALLALAAQNQPPFPPLILEPALLQPAVNPADVHMEASFLDPDAGDLHLASDWELWAVSPSERVWTALGQVGLASIHVHLGDGQFEGTLLGADALLPEKAYQLRTRHRDSSGDPLSEWGPYAVRNFTTTAASTFFPLEVEDVAEAPSYTWRQAATGAPVDLPGGTVPPQLYLESNFGQLLLGVVGSGSALDSVENPPALHHHVPLRVRLRAGSTAFQLPATDLEFSEHGCERHRVLLPSVSLGPFQQQSFWIAAEGSSFAAANGATEPDFDTALRLPDPPWVAERPGFVIEPVVHGLSLPVDLAFVPAPGPADDDVLCYVSELYGRIRAVTRAGALTTYASGLLNFAPTGAFPGSGEQGLTGLAVQPGSGDVFAALLYADPATGLHHPRVVRFTSTDGGRTAASMQTVLDLFGEVQGPSHQISNLEWLADGTLLVHMGDGFLWPTAQDPLSYRGKILRLHPDGSPPADNPFFDASDGFDARDFTYARGLRNPFGGDLRAADGQLYVVENGPFTDRLARVLPGADLGWAGANSTMTIGASWNWTPARAPVDIAFAQAETFGGGGFPPHLWDRAYVSLSGATFAAGPQLGAKRIVEFRFDAAGAVVGSPQTVARYVGLGRGSVAGLAFGPDGLYFSTLYPEPLGSSPAGPGASILRLRALPYADCNGNGQDDGCDLATGVSADCNLDLLPDECQGPEVVVRLGEPPNPAALIPGPGPGPIVGGSFTASVDHGVFLPAAHVDLLAAAAAPAALPTALGALLVDLSAPPLLQLRPAGQSFDWPIPADCHLVGRTVYTQAVSVELSGAAALTNALDVTVGF